MEPRFHDGNRLVRHRLEDLFQASGWDILSAIERGFRAQVDVKGKLAELFLHRNLCASRDRGEIISVEWFDRDGHPDFEIDVRGRKIRVECKNVRSGKSKFPGSHYVEIQKTRNSIEGGPGREYKADEFDILAACLFNQANAWNFLFCTAVNLARRTEWPDFLQIYQPVPIQAQGHWHATLDGVLGDLGL
jgi:hypothetical protein